MNKERLLPKTCLRVLLAIVLLICAGTVNASHFRFGHFTWEAKPEISPSTADFQLTVAFRGSAFGRPNIGQMFRPGYFYFGDGTSGYFNFEVIARNVQEDWVVGRAVQAGNESGLVRHTYPSANNNGKPWIASFASCCRIGSLRNASNASWRVITEVNLADGNRSPISNLPPIVTCSKYDCRFLVPAVDRDGDTLRWRMSSSAESQIRSIPSGIAVNETTGLFTWDDSENFTNGLYAVQVTIEDLNENGEKKSSVALDFIINLQENGANAWPVFESPPTPEAGSTITAVVGQTLTQVVQATDSDTTDEVFLNHVGLPAGATFEQTVTGGATGQAVLEWTPTAADIGEHIVTFLANDNRGGASTPVAVTINVIEPAISNVRIIDTISTKDITLNSSSFTVQPQHIDVQDDITKITWHFPSFEVGQLENLVAGLELSNLTPGEQRVVSHQLDVYYVDMNGEELHFALPEMVVKVSPTLTGVSIATDKTTYGPDEQVVINTAVNNLSEALADAIVVISVEDNQQNQVISYGPYTVESIPASGVISLDNVYFATAGTHVGMYEAVASIQDDTGKTLRRSSTPFSIVTENGTAVNLGSTVYTDKPVYRAWDQVIIDARAQNLASNSSFNGGQGSLIITDPVGDVIHQEIIQVNALAPSAITTRQVQLPLIDSPAGTFKVRWTVHSDSQTLTFSQATFDVVRSELQALVGRIEITHYDTGEPKSCQFATSNRSANDQALADLSYQVVQLSDGALVNEIRQKDVTVSNTTAHSLEVFVTDDLPDYGGYACVLSAEISGQMQELAVKGFYLHPPQLEASLTLASRGRLLVLMDNPGSGPHDVTRADEQQTYLNNLLTVNGWDYTIVHTQESFVTEFYSGHYSAVALLSEHVGLHPQTEELLVEAHNNGLGLLIGGAWNRRNNKIERELGVKVNGRNNAAGLIVLSDVILSEPEYMDGVVNSGVAFSHCQSQTWASYSSGKSANGDCVTDGGLAAVTGGHYGNGDNAYFGYDVLDAATLSASLHEDLLLHALQHIQPQQWNIHAGRIVPVALNVDNASRAASFDAKFEIAGGAIVSDSHYAVQLSDENTKALWQWDFAQPGTTVNTLYITLPEQPLTIDINADINAGISRRLLMDYAELQLSFRVNIASEQHAMDLINQLLQSGTGASNYGFVQKKLQQAESEIAKQRYEKALKPLLLAADKLANDDSDLAKQARLAIDEWLYQIQRLL